MARKRVQFASHLTQVLEFSNTQTHTQTHPTLLHDDHQIRFLSPSFKVTQTQAYGVIDRRHPTDMYLQYVIVNIKEAYTRDIILAALTRRRWCIIVDTPEDVPYSTLRPLHISDYESISWPEVLSGEQRASCYCVRKGMSRKAQLSLYLKKYITKVPQSALATSIPNTCVVQTWEAFNETLTINFTGDIASFDLGTSMCMSLEDRMDWAVCEAKDFMLSTSPGPWILKPSVTNKAANIALVRDYSGLLEELVETPDIREWVLQVYIARPLLYNRKKFHLRVYVLAVGAIRVYVHKSILLLTAAHDYTTDITDIYAHVSNSAKGAETHDFREEECVLLLNDLKAELIRTHGMSTDESQRVVQQLQNRIFTLAAELFKAFKGEYSVFCPMEDNFELFGLDFLIDSDFNTYLLEVNPGPDFKQTGQRLRSVIVGLMEDTLKLTVDPGCLGLEGLGLEALENETEFECVYAEKWSVAGMRSQLQMY